MTLRLGWNPSEWEHDTLQSQMKYGNVAPKSDNGLGDAHFTGFAPELDDGVIGVIVLGMYFLKKT